MHEGDKFIKKGLIVLLAVSLFFPLGIGLLGAASSQEEVETLDIIEITSTSVDQKGRNFTFPLPEWPQDPIPSDNQSITPSIPKISINRPIPFREALPRILLDQSTEKKRIPSPVKPLQAERPPYPRLAREQGWEGIVLLMLRVDEQGRVESVEVKESSGYPLLDSNAVQTVKLWTFSPAKNGNFPISSLVQLPVKFDLRQ